MVAPFGCIAIKISRLNSPAYLFIKYLLFLYIIRAYTTGSEQRLHQYGRCLINIYQEKQPSFKIFSITVIASVYGTSSNNSILVIWL